MRSTLQYNPDNRIRAPKISISILRCRCRYNVGSLKESAERIASAAAGAPEDHAIIFLGHNGPSGTRKRGSLANDIDAVLRHILLS